MKCTSCREKWAQVKGLCRGCAKVAGVVQARKPSQFCKRCQTGWVKKSGFCGACLNETAVVQKAPPVPPERPRLPWKPEPPIELEVSWSPHRDAPSLSSYQSAAAYYGSRLNRENER